MDDLFDDEEVVKRRNNIREGGKDPDIPHSASTFTATGNVVLADVRDTMKNIARNNITNLIDANKKIKEALKG